METLSSIIIPDGATVAFDTVALIYFLERHPAHFDTVRALLSRVEAGEVQGRISSLLFAELLVPAYRAGEDERAASVIRLLTSFPNLVVVPVSVAISAHAARLRARYRLRTPDAIHAATAPPRAPTGSSPIAGSSESWRSRCRSGSSTRRPAPWARPTPGRPRAPRSVAPADTAAATD